MSDRQSVKRGHEDSEKIPEKKVKDWGETECTICSGDFEENDNIRRLGCGHKFHNNCIYSWLDSRPTQKRRTCPTCSREVSPDEDAIYHGNIDTKDVLEQTDYDIPLFFGVVVCLNNNIVGKYFNIDLDLNVNSSIHDLRTAVLNKSNEWTNSALSSTKPTFKINKMYYGTPTNCNEIEGLNTELNITQSSQITLIDVYKDYYIKFHRNINDIRINRENGTYREKPNDKNLENLYYLHEINIDGQDKQTDYLYNPDNPDVPDNYIVKPSRIDEQYIEGRIFRLQPISIRGKSTYQRIAWIVFQVEEVRGVSKGGSTRKKQRNNKSKSHKYKK